MPRKKLSNVNPGVNIHIYQRAVDCGVIFYDVIDRLVYYTIAAVMSKKHSVTVEAASIMFTHIHQSVCVDSVETLSFYLHDTGTVFSRLFNRRYGRAGKLIQFHSGRAKKSSSKSIRTNLIYVFNNHVEKGLCKKAVEERWSFLAYSLSNHPFSAEIAPNSCSRNLKKAMRVVYRKSRKNKNLTYKDLKFLFSLLDENETEQFVDYVISQYSWIAFHSAARHFNSLEKMLVAIDSTTGSEYAIKEDKSPGSDMAYKSLIDFARKNNILDKIFTMSPDEQAYYSNKMFRTVAASQWQIKKFLHIDAFLG